MLNKSHTGRVSQEAYFQVISQPGLQRSCIRKQKPQKEKTIKLKVVVVPSITGFSFKVLLLQSSVVAHVFDFSTQEAVAG